jgi:two-component system chemotaxis response regulator CheY
MNILVVDDVSFMRKIFTDMLVNIYGLNKSSIFEASGGNSAVREYKRIKPGVVFLDVLMPDKNGTEVVGEIMAFDPNAYIVMCSSANEKAIVEECAKAGAKDYIIKPIDPERLKIALKKCGFKFSADDYLENEKKAEAGGQND